MRAAHGSKPAIDCPSPPEGLDGGRSIRHSWPCNGLQNEGNDAVTTVAFLGLGRMGLPMAVNLRAAGHDLVVWNRTRSKADEFADQHASRRAASPAECAAKADVVISMLADDAAVVAAHTGSDGTFGALRPGAVVVDMSTIA